MSDVTELPPLQQTILRKLILRQSERPLPFDAYEVYKQFNYRKYTDEEVYGALAELSKEGYVEATENGKFLIPRDRYLDIRRHHKWRLFFSSDLFMPIVVIPILMVLISTTFTGVFFKTAPIKQPGRATVQEEAARTSGFDERLLQLEREMASIKTIPSEAREAAAFQEMRNKVQQLETSARDLTEALRFDPSKAIQLSALRSDLEAVRNELMLSSQSLQREIERVSSYNTTIILFMITFLAAWMVLVLASYLKDRRKDG